MAYFPVTFDTLNQIASQGSFEDVAGFLVVSRHADGKPLPGYRSHQFSGAGIESLRVKLKVAEEAARGVFYRLQERGFLRPAQDEIKAASRFSRWELQSEKNDFFLSHYFVDPGATWLSPIARLKKANFTGATEELEFVSDADRRLDCLMVLLFIHRRTAMVEFGGLNPRAASRLWSVETREQGVACTRWGAVPGRDHFSRQFVEECLAHCKDLERQRKTEFPRFFAAWYKLKELGLIYEAVTLFGGLSHKAPGDRRYAVRINDFFAGGGETKGDPSVMTSLEGAYGTALAFYTQPNESLDGEGLRVLLPDADGCLIGIWRPRFRPSDPDTGKWHRSETDEVAKAVQSISQSTSAEALA